MPNETLRYKVWRGPHTDEVAEPNVFAAEAALAAFERSEDWLDALRAYIQDNKKAAANYIE